MSAPPSRRTDVASSSGSPVSSAGAVSWSTAASGVPSRSFAELSSSSTSLRDAGGGGSASARPSHATAAAGAPQLSASAATRRRSSTRSASPAGSAATICAAIRSSERPRSVRICGRSGVRLGAFVRADVGVDGLTDDRMRELEAVGAA